MYMYMHVVVGSCMYMYHDVRTRYDIFMFQFCEDRLLAFCEDRLWSQLTSSDATVTRDVIHTIHLAQVSNSVLTDVHMLMQHYVRIAILLQMYNASQLASACLSYVSNNFSNFSRADIESLSPHDREQVLANRWPPEEYSDLLTEYEELLRREKASKRSKHKCVVS